jgi:hypothetical protein
VLTSLLSVAFRTMNLSSFALLAAALVCGSLAFAPAVDAAPPGWDLDEEQQAAPSLTGELIQRTQDAVTLVDATGEKHTFRLTEQTRYVYGATSSPSDFRVGARIRADYSEWLRDRVALAVWVLGQPAH